MMRLGKSSGMLNDMVDHIEMLWTTNRISHADYQKLVKFVHGEVYLTQNEIKQMIS